ncbi:hypothetical protein TRFO_08974 [Tritrichomonas foetus]|uniref:Uncharacterized protein n=1 Tax=Tritrichomonas foetus TaxID=1144522 RepID=A0A1J4JJ53_9EUKA|nr:hypothetical protein TRFO_08974 [Tritrichomonas foetus]|eukprot:OHS98375.1 hypothetical protein TRFO_08974 [Tritrichomonas foetus]
MKSESLLNNQDLINLREKLYSKCELSEIPTDKLNALLGHLREYSSYCGLTRKYPEAKQADQLYDKVHSEVALRSLVPCDLTEEVDSFENKKEEELDRLTQEIIEFDNETNLKREQLKQKQENDYKEFERTWKEDMPKKYRKISPQLLSLMTIEKKCARVGEFDKAEIIKKEVDQRMQIEMDQAQSQLNFDYHDAKEKFLENQTKEKESFEEVRNHWKSVMVARHKEELTPIANRQNVIQIRQTKQFKIEPVISHSTTTGSVSKVINEIGMDYEALLPPLIEPNDEKMIEREKQERLQKLEKAKKLKERMKAKNEERIKKIQDLVLKTCEDQNQKSVFTTQNISSKLLESDESDVEDLDKLTNNEKPSANEKSPKNIKSSTNEKSPTNEKNTPQEQNSSRKGSGRKKLPKPRLLERFKYLQYPVESQQTPPEKSPQENNKKIVKPKTKLNQETLDPQRPIENESKDTQRLTTPLKTSQTKKKQIHKVSPSSKSNSKPVKSDHKIDNLLNEKFDILASPEKTSESQNSIALNTLEEKTEISDDKTDAIKNKADTSYSKTDSKEAQGKAQENQNDNSVSQNETAKDKTPEAPTSGQNYNTISPKPNNNSQETKENVKETNTDAKIEKKTNEKENKQIKVEINSEQINVANTNSDNKSQANSKDSSNENSTKAPPPRVTFMIPPKPVSKIPADNNDSDSYYYSDEYEDDPLEKGIPMDDTNILPPQPTKAAPSTPTKAPPLTPTKEESSKPKNDTPAKSPANKNDNDYYSSSYYYESD